MDTFPDAIHTATPLYCDNQAACQLVETCVSQMNCKNQISDPYPRCPIQVTDSVAVDTYYMCLSCDKRHSRLHIYYNTCSHDTYNRLSI
jgi:hypothetical protein